MFNHVLEPVQINVIILHAVCDIEIRNTQIHNFLSKDVHSLNLTQFCLIILLKSMNLYMYGPLLRHCKARLSTMLTGLSNTQRWWVVLYDVSHVKTVTRTIPRCFCVNNSCLMWPSEAFFSRHKWWKSDEMESPSSLSSPAIIVRLAQEQKPLRK